MTIARHGSTIAAEFLIFILGHARQMPPARQSASVFIAFSQSFQGNARWPNIYYSLFRQHVDEMFVRIKNAQGYIYGAATL